MMEQVLTGHLLVVMFVFLSSLLVASFIGALTYRLPRGIGFVFGRSFCDSCNKEIPIIYNIPLFSYLLLRGRSACCQKPISYRYPLIEFLVALIATAVYLLTNNILYLPVVYLISAVFIIDIENQYIPDSVSWLLLFYSLVFGLSYEKLFAGFFVSLLLLLINFITKGKGMGLGDVKLTLALGVYFNLFQSLYFLLGSFLTGGLVASILLLRGKAGMKTKIAFGPFIVISFVGSIIYFNNVY